MGKKKRGSGERRAVRTPRPATRSTPRPGRNTPSKGGKAAPGVERHSRLIAQRSTTKPTVLVIVAIGLLGLVGIIVYAAATTKTVGSSQQDVAGTAGGSSAPRPQAAPSSAVKTPPAIEPAMAVAPKPVTKGPRAPRIKLTGVITDDGRDDRTLAIACASCGAAIDKGSKKCSSCNTPVEWPAETDCPFCHGTRGSGVCGSCGGQEAKRMMGIVFTCSSCDGSMKCRRCTGTGKLTF